MSDNYTKYPKEIASIVRTKTFCVDHSFSRPNIDDGEEPLKMYGKFSRIKMAVISDGKSSTGNVTISDVHDIIARSNFIMNKDLEREYEDMMTAAEKGDDAGAENLPLAYTVEITSGKLKGKTPAEVILEDPENGKALLNNQYQFLAKNVDKYPRNKIQMEAIASAAELAKKGELVAVKREKKEFPIYKIYSGGMKPLVSKTRNDGKSFVYELSISYNMNAPVNNQGDRYPVEVLIENYYAPVTKRDDGRLNVLKSQKDDTSVIRNKMDLSAAEWRDVLAAIETNMRTYENMVAPVCFKESETISKLQYNKAKEQDKMAS